MTSFRFALLGKPAVATSMKIFLRFTPAICQIAAIEAAIPIVGFVPSNPEGHFGSQRRGGTLK